MCGRLNVIDDPLTRWVSDVLGIKFTAQTNSDLRPTQTVETITAIDSAPQQLTTIWGIRPPWSKSLIINARAETVAENPTFKEAFSTHRCLIPCTGWYEWRSEGGPKKQRYCFSHVDHIPVLMAGIWFEQPTGPALVTLTTKPLPKCAEFHNRVPLLIEPENINRWLNGKPEEVTPLLALSRETHISIEKA